MQLAAQAWILGNAAFLAALAASAAATPLLVLLLTFAVGIGIALRGPAWQASIRDLVPDEQVPAAVTLSSAGFNLSRALGPVLGGVLVAAVGATGAFAFHVLVSLGLLGVLLAVPRTPAQQPAQSVRGALASGVGYVLSTPVLRSVLVRAAAIGVPASATLALLPVFATEQLGGGPVVYGALLGCFGAGAIVGAVVLPALRRWLSAEDLVSAAIAVSAGSLAALAAGPDALLAGVALLGGGVAWIAMLSTLNIAVQFTAAAPLRGRALAAYMTCAFGGLAVGSALWGALAARFGLSVSLLAAAATLACGAALRLWFALPADQR
jgi:predicted MFS family arabinose efflux permease